MKTAIKCAIAVVLAVVRIMGHKSEAFQAVAHLFVGGLFASAWLQFSEINTEKSSIRHPPLARENLILAVLLSLIELGCFLWHRFSG